VVDKEADRCAEAAPARGFATADELWAAVRPSHARQHRHEMHGMIAPSLLAAMV
jgi:hypothetical protein